jgi:hypothetical protein
MSLITDLLPEALQLGALLRFGHGEAVVQVLLRIFFEKVLLGDEFVLGVGY